MKNRKIILLLAIALMCVMFTSCSAQNDSFLDTIFSVFPEDLGVREFIENFEFTTFCVDAFNNFVDQLTATIDTIASTDFRNPAAIIFMIIQIPLWLIILAVIFTTVIVAAIIDLLIAVVVSIIVPAMIAIVCIIYIFVIVINIFMG